MHLLIISGLLSVTVAILFFRSLKASALKRLHSRREDEAILFCKSANFSGFSSLGFKQIRGNGLLALYEDELVFEMLLPAKEVVVPVAAIKHIDTVKTHAGRGLMYPQLHIIYENNDKTEGVAWAVKHLEEWLAILNQMIEQQ